MTNLRLGFYVLYVVLGIVIIVRLLSAGLRWEMFSGILLGILLIVLGLYRLDLYRRARAAKK